MEKVYIASYKSVRSGLTGLVNRIIRTLDKTEFSHTEICIGNPLEGVVACYSASGVDHGVRVKMMQVDPEHWEVLELPYAKAEDIEALFDKTKGLPYDYMGVGRFAFPWMLREHAVKYFCSEWAAEALKFEGAWRFSPATVRNAALTMGGLLVEKQG